MKRAPLAQSRQRGSTVVAALLLVALIAVLGAHLMRQQSHWFQQVKLGQERAQALALARAGMDYGRAVLADDERKSGYDHPEEFWARPLPAMNVEGGVISGQIEDLQGRFNLNNIAPDGRISPPHLAIYRRLLNQLGLSPTLADTLADWLDKDDELISPDGAEDAYYLRQSPPRRAGQQVLSSVAELTQIRGYTPQVVARLRPFVTALPTVTWLNINTTTPEVLQATLGVITPAEAIAVTDLARQEAFKENTQISSRMSAKLGRADLDLTRLGVGSRYFLIRGEVAWGDVAQQWNVSVERQGSGLPRVLGSGAW